MIRVAVTPLTDGLRLKAQGHAGYGPWGRDIVCSAVSALLYGFVAYLEGLPPAKIHCSVLAEEAVKAALEDYYKRKEEAK